MAKDASSALGPALPAPRTPDSAGDVDLPVLGFGLGAKRRRLGVDTEWAEAEAEEGRAGQGVRGARRAGAALQGARARAGARAGARGPGLGPGPGPGPGRRVSTRGAHGRGGEAATPAECGTVSMGVKTSSSLRQCACKQAGRRSV